jgi:hypothetical protein
VQRVVSRFGFAKDLTRFAYYTIFKGQYAMLAAGMDATQLALFCSGGFAAGAAVFCSRVLCKVYNNV